MIRIISSVLIPIALYVSYFALMAHFEDLYKNNDFSLYRKCVIIGNTVFALLTILIVFIYNGLFGY